MFAILTLVVGVEFASAQSRSRIEGTVKDAKTGEVLPGANVLIVGTTVRNDATKLVFDLGVKYYTLFKDFRFGMAIRNFSSDIKRELISEQLPLTFTIGGAIDLMDFFNETHDKNTSLTVFNDVNRFSVEMSF